MSYRLLMLALTLAVVAGCSGGGTPAPAPMPTTGPGSPGIPSPAATASPSPAVTTAPTAAGSAQPTPPAPEASTFAQETADLNAYSAAVDAACPGNPTAATRFDVELLQANGSYLVSVLPGMSVAQAQTLAAHAVAYAVAESKVLPGIGVLVNPSYPLLVRNQANAPAWWSTASNYPIASAYYAALAQGLSQNGIAYDAEDNLVFPAYSGQNYSAVTVSQLEAGVAENGSNLLTLMAPSDLNLASEPLTLSQNTGQTSFDTPSGFQSYASAVRSALVIPPGSKTAIGAGSADWSAPSFLTAVAAVPGFDYEDLHLYPPDVLATATGGVAQVESIDPAVTGKPGVITENWDEKDAGDAGNYGASEAPSLEQQDAYSFWASLDARYITTTMKFARCEDLSMVAFWYQNELFSYLDYASASSMTPQQAQSAIGMAGYAAATAGTLSPSGQALYEGLTGRSPASRRGARGLVR